MGYLDELSFLPERAKQLIGGAEFNGGAEVFNSRAFELKGAREVRQEALPIDVPSAVRETPVITALPVEAVLDAGVTDMSQIVNEAKAQAIAGSTIVLEAPSDQQAA
jgi:hypothetical protein